MSLHTTKPRQGLRSLSVILAALYAGLVLGISFVATPAKFGAASLTLAAGLDAGQAIFHAMAVVEWVLGGLLLVTVLFSRGGWWLVVMASLVIVLRLLEDLWLLPVLDARVKIIIAGGTNPAGPHHTIYAAFDVLKFVLLLVLASLNSRKPRQPTVG